MACSILLAMARPDTSFRFNMPAQPLDEVGRTYEQLHAICPQCE